MTTTIIDANGLVLGRMATDVAKRALNGETVHIVNAEKAIVTGSSKEAIQARYKFKREVGTHRKGPFFPREPHLLVKRTVRGMIKYQSSQGRAAFKRIKAYIGVPKDLVGLDRTGVAGADRDPRVFMTIAEISTYLGRPTTPVAELTEADVKAQEQLRDAPAVPVAADSEDEAGDSAAVNADSEEE